jgi:hypothetical protein
MKGPFRWPEDFDEADIADATYRQQQEQAAEDARYAAEFDRCVTNPVDMDAPREDIEADCNPCREWETDQ